ncbi:MFS transporter [Asticcacaulis sp. YBE204]|uniref:MFS transporter n=1 Tax=Asticcacaulis sp. YBE204 TaxID=1282363 RepID=UPI0003C3C066|nr:MFS transporter [Asticcacaulis sp. YBE204]ESQ79664.1 hypothetical protein AEYBE204_07425 [Asticcacaulis sp. YBE204]
MTSPIKMTPALTGLFALACGVIVGNLYYSQPVIELIAPDIGLSSQVASLIVSLTQIGYVAGMLFIAPLLDLFENKRLILISLGMAFVSLILSATAQNGGVFLFVAFITGLSAVSVQMLIPLAAHMASDESRGRVVGNIMGGLLLGILLARPVSSLIADHFGWRMVFFAAAVVMIVIGGVLALTLPQYRPAHRAGYGALLKSMGVLWVRHPTLRQRSLLQATMFGTFSLFWTAAPLELWRMFHLSQSQIAVFALAGAAGALAAPISGRLGDAGHGARVTLIGLIGAAVAMVTGIAWVSVIGLAITGIVLDACVQLTMIQGQRTIYALDPLSRGRLNGLYMASIFIGGAIGSALASPLYAHGGWAWIAAAGTIAALLGLVIFLNGNRKAVAA